MKGGVSACIALISSEFMCALYDLGWCRVLDYIVPLLGVICQKKTRTVTNDSSTSGAHEMNLENGHLNTIRYFSEIKHGNLGMLVRECKMIESPCVF